MRSKQKFTNMYKQEVVEVSLEPENDEPDQKDNIKVT